MAKWTHRLSDKSVLPCASDYDCFGNSSKYNLRWLWTDIETSSLEPRDPKFRILEVSMMVTDVSFNVVDRLHIVLQIEPDDIFYMSRWCTKQFSSHRGGNGLLRECLNSKISPHEAGHLIQQFIERHAIRRRDDPRNVHRVMLAGASVWFDRLSILTIWPFLHKYISHRVIDVSSLLEVARLFRTDTLPSLPPTSGIHRTDPDVYESINLMRWANYNFFGHGLFSM